MNRIAAGVLALAAVSPIAAETVHTVVVEGMKFEPATITVKRGDKVVWQNRDIVPHTATAAGKFDSGHVDGGKSWTWTAGATGRIDSVCPYHPGMKAVAVVE